MREIYTSKKDGHIWEIYRDRVGKWRWIRYGRDREVVGSAFRGFDTKKDCIENGREYRMPLRFGAAGKPWWKPWKIAD